MTPLTESLTGAVKTFYILEAERVIELCGIYAVVLYGVGVTHYDRVLKARQRAEHPLLNVGGKGRGKAL